MPTLPKLPAGYSTKAVSLQLEHLPIQLTLIQNLDELLEQLIAKGPEHEDVRDERIPYWAELWPSALALSRHLVCTNAVQPGQTVLEMGCGLGLPGLVAGKLGAQVVLSDYLPDALSFAAYNWSQNHSETARVELLDWRYPRPELASDLLLASDIAYESRALPYLAPAFRALCRPGGRILVADPSRSASANFFKKLPEQGFSVEVFSYIEPYNSHAFRIQVYAISPV